MKNSLLSVIVSVLMFGSIHQTTLADSIQLTSDNGYKLFNHDCRWINGYFRGDGTYVIGHWRGCNFHW